MGLLGLSILLFSIYFICLLGQSVRTDSVRDKAGQHAGQGGANDQILKTTLRRTFTALGRRQ